MTNTTTTARRAFGPMQRAAAAAALATAELRYALAESGYPSPGAGVRLLPEGDRFHAVVRVPAHVPGRTSDAAVVRALRQARAIHPEVRLVDRRFESLAPID
jgi:hypothetical protein